ncbi:hypothetical protein J6590_038919 [Homalodisca vitripennis]|nr:hypothetical protein J6590_038919 [Homalodisca vitripennis]
MTDFVLFDGGYETQLRKYVGSGFEGHPLWVSRYLTENPEACRKVVSGPGLATRLFEGTVSTDEITQSNCNLLLNLTINKKK